DLSDVLLDWLEFYPGGEVEEGVFLFNKVADRILVTNRKSKNKYSLSVPSQTSNRQPYVVTIHVGRGIDVNDSCNCKAFERMGGCKHVVAGVLHLLIEELYVTPSQIEMVMDYEYDILPASMQLPEYEPIALSETIIPSSDSKTDPE